MEETHSHLQSNSKLNKVTIIMPSQRRIKRIQHPSIQHKKPSFRKNKLQLLMIKISLSQQYNQKQYKLICSLKPKQWLMIQRELLNQMVNDNEMYEKYFEVFYENHVRLANWYHLATKEKLTLGEYVFKEFLCKKKDFIIIGSFNNQKLKETFEKENINKTIKCKDQSKIQPVNHISVIQNHNLSQQTMNQNDSNQNQRHESENCSFMLKPSLFQVQNMAESTHKRDKQLKKVKIKESIEIKLPQAQYHHQTKHVRTATIKTHNHRQFSNLSREKQQQLGVCLNHLLDLNSSSHRETFINNNNTSPPQSKRKPLNLKQYKLKKLQQDIIDPHELFVNTFDACNGRKYIFYDYEKHVKGQKNTKKYNEYLRSNKLTAEGDDNLGNRNNYDNVFDLKNQFNMTCFEEFQDYKNKIKEKEKMSLLPVNLILNERQMNTMKGIRKVISSNKSNKVVFVNHQGKPITYYIKKNKDIMFGANQRKGLTTR